MRKMTKILLCLSMLTLFGACGSSKKDNRKSKKTSLTGQSGKLDFDVQYSGNLTIYLQEPLDAQSTKGPLKIMVHTHDISVIPFETDKKLEFVPDDGYIKPPYISIGCEDNWEEVPCSGSIVFKKFPTAKFDTTTFDIEVKIPSLKLDLKRSYDKAVNS